jgi:AcrR family transcriptional regulator
MYQRETEKHRQIMTAAAALFARQGYQKTSIDEIVREAGISKGLYYHYFENKKELYIHLYNSYADILSNTICERVALSETDFFERLKQVSHIRIDFAVSYPSLYRFLYSAYYEEHPDIAPLIKNKNEELLQNSYQSSASNIDWSKLKQGLSPDRAIELVTWVADGFAQKIATTKGVDNTEAYGQFAEYLDYLRTGMYESKGGQDVVF